MTFTTQGFSSVIPMVESEAEPFDASSTSDGLSCGGFMPDAGNTQAFILIALLIITPAVCIAGFGKPGRWRIRVGLIAGPLMALFCAQMGIHLCDTGDAIMQWMIPGACITAALVFVRNPWIRFTTVALYFAVSIWLCQDYVRLVHSGYHGNPTYLEHEQGNLLAEVRQRVRGNAAGDSAAYPAGWMNEAPFSGLIDGVDFNNPGVAPPLWHSWLTGLYAWHPGGIWFPGGRLAESVDKIEYRERIP